MYDVGIVKPYDYGKDNMPYPMTRGIITATPKSRV